MRSYGQNCPECGATLQKFENPDRFVCGTHGVIPGEKVLRPDVTDQKLDYPAKQHSRRKSRKKK